MSKQTLDQLNLAEFGEFINNDDVRSHYTLGKVLGNGTYGVVRQGTNKQTGVGVAIKIINKRNNSLSQKMLDNEKIILQKVRHPNIIALEALYETNNYLFFVMELVTGGELFDHLMQKGSFSEKEASRIIRQILEALKYLHSLEIVHRDLKPQNILCEMDAKGSINTVKVTDFGLSRVMMGATLQSCVGSPLYVAPELLMAEGYGEKVDVWSVGCILYNLLSGLYPFFAEENNALFRAILTEDLQLPDPEWTCISEGAKSLVRALLDRNVGRRPTAEVALTHPWLNPTQNLATNKSITGIGDKLRSLVSTMEAQIPRPVLKPANPNGGDVVNQLYNINGETLRWDDDIIVSVLGDKTERVKIPKDTAVLDDAGKFEYIYIVKSGSLRVERQYDGKALTLLVYTAPCSVGSHGVLNPSGTSTMSYITNCDLEALKIPLSAVTQLIDSNHTFAAQFFRRVALDAAQLLLDSKTRIDSVINSNYEGGIPKARSFVVPGEKEVFVGEFACKWTRKIEKFGTLYVLPSQLLATSIFFSIKTKVSIPFVDITSITPKKTSLILVVNKESKKKKPKQEKIVFHFTEERFEAAKSLIIQLWTDHQSKPVTAEKKSTTTQQDEEEIPGTLTSADWQDLQKLAEYKIFKRNSVIVSEGERSDKIYYILDGRCKVVQVRPEDDAEVTVGYIRARETFGEVGYLTNDKASASVVTDAETTAISVIHGAHIAKLAESKPGFYGRLYKYLAAVITAILERRIRQTLAKTINRSSAALPTGKLPPENEPVHSLIDALKQRKSPATIKQLVERGLTVAGTDSSDTTPLHVAAIDPTYVEIVLMLIQNKANVNALDGNNWSPLHAAASVGNLQACKILIGQGADVAAATKEGNLPLHYIVKNHFKAAEIPLACEIIDLMLKNSNVNRQTNNGETPLHYCVFGKSIELVQHLLSRGADVNLTNKRGNKPADIAKLMKQEKLLEMLTPGSQPTQSPPSPSPSPASATASPDPQPTQS